MGLENIGDKLENTNGIENRTESLEKNIKIEKPESIEKQETAKNFINKLENNEYYSTRDERLAQTPRENGVDSKGTWQGERGESKYVPNDEKAQTILKEHGQNGIQYKDGIPNFTDVSIEDVTLPVLSLPPLSSIASLTTALGANLSTMTSTTEMKTKEKTKENKLFTIITFSPLGYSESFFVHHMKKAGELFPPLTSMSLGMVTRCH